MAYSNFVPRLCMKKIINAILLFIIPLTLVSCNNNENITEKDSANVSVQSAAPYADTEKPQTVIIPSNNIDPSKVSESTSSIETTTSKMVKYTIVSGDSLSQIAMNFDTTLEEIIRINKITDAYKIFVDQVILIPTKNTENTTTTSANEDKKNQPTTKPSSSNTKNYAVKEGDSGYSIALAHSITLEEFAKLNSKTIDELNLLYVGDVVLVPQ
jgi:LysM repeat protein